jgi:CRP/FNR family transcriptional regulator, nitrogen fixation regulation protein
MVAGTITAPNASFPVRSFAAVLRIFTIREFPEFSERFCGAFVHLEVRFLRIGSSKTKGATMRTKIHAADYYRRILSVQDHALKRLDSIAKIVRCNRGQEIACEPGPSGQWYYVIVGAVRRSAVRSDGRRQIIDLMLPQDFFFVADTKRDETIEAIAEETVLASYPGTRVELFAERDREFARELREVALQSLDRIQNQLMILGGVTAVEKVGSFLLSLDGRVSERRGQVELPVTRYDIAEYLAVSVETVCRAITYLQQHGVITLAGTRTVKILNRGALEDHAADRFNVNGSGRIAA